MISSGGPRNSAPGTLNHLFFDAVDKYDKPDALRVKKGLERPSGTSRCRDNEHADHAATAPPCLLLARSCTLTLRTRV